MIITFKSPADFAANLKAAFRAASEDESRKLLCVVRIEIRAGVARFVATNGHWLWANETPCFQFVGVDEKGKHIIGSAEDVVHIPSADVKRILRAINTTKKAAGWAVDLDTLARTVTQLSVVTPFGAYTEKFPPYLQIIPQNITPKKRPTMTYDTRYLIEVAAAFDDVVGKVKSGVGLSFEQTGNDVRDPVLVTSSKASALVVLMPRNDDPSAPGVLVRYLGKSTVAA